MIVCCSAFLFVLGLGIAAEGLVAPASGQAPSSGEWVVPRTVDGHPDLQGRPWATSCMNTPATRAITPS